MLGCIDGVFMIWRISDDDLTDALHKINKQHPVINFDFVILKETVSFLDAKFFKDHWLSQRD